MSAIIYLFSNKLKTTTLNSGECFGLVGMTGAGKSSTFRMLTGTTSISSGEIFVTGLNLKTHMRQALKSTGYCPEYNALHEDLKGSQALEIFGLLHGCRPDDISKMIKELAADLNFKSQMDERIERYSDADKRKLQTAIALIGILPAIYLGDKGRCNTSSMMHATNSNKIKFIFFLQMHQVMVWIRNQNEICGVLYRRCVDPDRQSC